MASAKKAKSRKTAKRAVPRPSRKQRALENVQSPEELMAKLDAASAEHDTEVKDLGERFLKVMRKTNYHPTVVLDTLQALLSSGIATTLGEDQGELFDAHIRAYHQDSKMLSVAKMLGVSLADLIVDPGTEDESETSTATPEPLGGPNDYSQGT